MVELSQKVFGAVFSQQSSARRGRAGRWGENCLQMYECFVAARLNGDCLAVMGQTSEPVSIQLSPEHSGRVLGLMNGSQPRSNIVLLLLLLLTACISGWATADYIHILFSLSSDF